jgi:2-amino-4-hydroxy-6-hydroxymethyldihydropteridine diphosphokinase
MSSDLGIRNSENHRYAIVALGSNLGRSREAIQAGITHAKFITDHPIFQSSIWETTPVDCPPNSPKFLNAVVAFVPRKGETPETLLVKLQKLEKVFGRQPKKVLNEPRPLDVDLIAFGQEVRSTAQLTLPHPRAHLRRFVLEPLYEIAPDLILPGQTKTLAQLLAALPAGETCVKV